ncbi:5-formyltetrahydrofolate cyclo-ligase [Acuticoccus sp.]|uniref:5-formyltetrahydrofolate cyclo-ligase n=1 Tax=Acuticoccus sp. TaxID=1904378 RepID=UPI003B51BDB3
MDVVTDKASARRAARERRAIAALAARDAPQALAAAASVLPRAEILAGYVPIRDEIDPGPLLKVCSVRARIALPRVGREGLEFLVMGEGDELVPGPFGLREPSGGTRVAPQLLLVPLLAFTRRGDRLGYGKGHYDRYLAWHPGVRAVGLAYAAQEVDALPVEAHDAQLWAILTEQELIVASSGTVGA